MSARDGEQVVCETCRDGAEPIMATDGTGPWDCYQCGRKADGHGCSYTAALTRPADTRESDTKRLEWLAEVVLDQRAENWMVHEFTGRMMTGPNLRAAIDLAMGVEPQ